MKKLFAIAFTLLLTGSLSWAQASGADKTPPADKKVTKTSSAESKVALNPQPLPPGEKSKTTSAADKVSLNPQPLPPKERKAGGDPASKVALNPQPLPPNERKAGGEQAESKVALNPQPEPPGATASTKKKSSAAGKKVSTPAGSTAKQ